MDIRVFAAGILATNARHGREIIINDDTDVSSEEARTRTAFFKLGMEAKGNTLCGARAETALRYVLGEPMIDCAIVGLAEIDLLGQVLNAAAVGAITVYRRGGARLKPAGHIAAGSNWRASSRSWDRVSAGALVIRTPLSRVFE